MLTNMCSQLMLGESRPRTWEEWRNCIVNPQGGSSTVRKAGKEEFDDFVVRTWSQLVRQETRSMGGKPSIASFCRMDIAIRMSEANEPPQYFVNEVERTLTTSLWLKVHRKSMEKMADSFSMLFRKWLSDAINPYIV